MKLIARTPFQGPICLAFLQNMLRPGRRTQKDPPDKQEQKTDRKDRDLILEFLDRHPDAFRSELDLENMARLYRCRF